jgi:hypothetical protein
MFRIVGAAVYKPVYAGGGFDPLRLSPGFAAATPIAAITSQTKCLAFMANHLRTRGQTSAT